jgi:putative ABC transport system permease protein
LATVIGVVGNVRFTDPTRDSPATIYVPHRFWSTELMDYTIRTSDDPMASEAAVRQMVAELDPELPVRDLRPLGDFVSAAKAPTRFVLTVLVTFAIAALLLSAVGLYGLLAFSVRRRVHELGIRMAMGAEPTRLVRMVLRDGVSLAVAGLIMGLVLAMVLAASATLFTNTGRADPLVYGMVAVLVVVVACLASALPAHWATTVDPVTALKAE